MWNSKSSQRQPAGASRIATGSVRRPSIDKSGPTEAENARLQALAKQLSQLDATSSKIGETLRFISDFNNDIHGHPVLRGAHAPQQLHQLHSLQEKLKEAVAEIERLQGHADPGHDQQHLQHAATDKPHALAVPDSRQESAALSPAPSSSTYVRISATGDGGVAGTVARLTREAADENAAVLGKVKEEQRRLQQQKKELADMERDNDELRAELARVDVRALRERQAALQGSLREARAAEEELRTLEAVVARLPVLQSEAEALRPVATQVDALEAQLRGLRNLDAQRLALSKDIAALQPKVLLVDKMSSRVEQLQAEVQKGEALQERVTVLQAEADRLPALRTRMYALQANAAEARQLEKLLHEYGRQEELLVRLQHQEEELQSRVAGIEELKDKVATLKVAASEVDQLEARFASLASTTSQLPLLKSQVAQLQERAHEVEQLEAEAERLKNVDHECKALRRQVEDLRPHAEALEALRREHQLLLAATADADTLAALGTGHAHTPRPYAAADGPSVAAIVRTLSSSTQALRSPTLQSSPEQHLVAAAAPPPPPPPVVLQLNIHVPEPPLLPPGVSAELARQRAEAEALTAAEAELRELDALQVRLKQQIEVLQASPAASEVVRLQAELLQMQNREVEQLTREVEQLAGVGVRLQELKAQHEALEREADEVFVLQSQLPELEAAATQAGMLRRRKEALGKDVLEVQQLEKVIAEADAAVARRPALQAQLQALEAKKAEVEKLNVQLAELPAVEARLARARHQLQEMQQQARQASEMEEEHVALRHQMALAAGCLGAGAAAAAAHGAPAGARELTGAADGTAAVGVGSGDGAVEGTSGGGAAAVAAAAAAGSSSKQGSAGGGSEEAQEEEAALATHLSQVRARHAALLAQRQELLRLTAQSDLLLKDNELLKMQLNVAVSMYGNGNSATAAAAAPAEAPATAAGEGQAGASPAVAEGEEGEAEDSKDEEHGAYVLVNSAEVPPAGLEEHGGAQGVGASSGDGQAAGEEAAAVGTAEQQAGQGAAVVQGPLHAVFQRIRALEGDKMELQASNEELTQEVERLRSALEMSLGRLDAFKGLAQSINMIRGKKAAATYEQ